MRLLTVILWISIATFSSAADSGVPKEIEALYPMDGKNTVIARVDQDADVYVLIENNDGEVGALFLYRFNGHTQKAEVLKASETLLPFDQSDVRTPPLKVQSALATAWAKWAVSKYPGGAAKMTEYWQSNAASWKRLPIEVQDAFKAAGVTAPTG